MNYLLYTVYALSLFLSLSLSLSLPLFSLSQPLSRPFSLSLSLSLSLYPPSFFSLSAAFSPFLTHQRPLSLFPNLLFYLSCLILLLISTVPKGFQRRQKICRSWDIFWTMKRKETNWVPSDQLSLSSLSLSFSLSRTFSIFSRILKRRRIKRKIRRTILSSNLVKIWFIFSH